MKYCLGVDTGDTFTDAVLMNCKDNSVVETTKVRTTHGDLSRGLLGALQRVLDKIEPHDVALVSVSTTLATNAIVEGRGEDVGLFTIGWQPEDGWEFPTEHIAKIEGRFNVRGEELVPLDTTSLREVAGRWSDRLSTFAVSSYFSVRNPSHEQRAKNLLSSIDSIPIVCGHELTERLGIYDRTVTAVLNAKIIPIISSFIDGIEQALGEWGLNAPVMVVKSDGTLISAKKARQRPIETVFSGPAASAIGARWLSDEDDSLVIDIGGTTTDIAHLENGFPALNSEGATVGRWRTRVKSIDVRSVGLGGDSRIGFDSGDEPISIGPRKVTPLAFAQLKEEDLGEMKQQQSTGFLVARNGKVSRNEWNEKRQRIYELIRNNQPIHEDRVREQARAESIFFASEYLEEFIRHGLVSRIDFTPTDLLHVLGIYEEGNLKNANSGAEIWARVVEDTVSVGRFCEKIKEDFERSVAREIVKKLIHETEPDCRFEQNLVWGFCTQHLNSGFPLSAQFNLSIPLVGIGAPAKAFLPRVGELLHTDFITVDHYEVGNAVGAVVSSVVSRVEVLVVEQPETEQFILFLPDEREIIPVDEEGEAMKVAEGRAREIVRLKVAESGGGEAKIKLRDRKFNHGRGKVKVIGIGNPKSLTGPYEESFES